MASVPMRSHILRHVRKKMADEAASSCSGRSGSQVGKEAQQFSAWNVECTGKDPVF